MRPGSARSEKSGDERDEAERFACGRDLRPVLLVAPTPEQLGRRRRRLKLMKLAQSEAEQRWMDEFARSAARKEERQWVQAAGQREADVAQQRQAAQEFERRCVQGPRHTLG